jgi:hypothetical protein
MTREEILDTAVGKKFKINHEIEFVASMAAMSFYAKQQSILFTKYLRNNHWISRDARFFQKLNSDIEKDPLYSHDELYELFLKDQNISHD